MTARNSYWPGFERIRSFLTVLAVLAVLGGMILFSRIGGEGQDNRLGSASEDARNDPAGAGSFRARMPVPFGG